MKNVEISTNQKRGIRLVVIAIIIVLVDKLNPNLNIPSWLPLMAFGAGIQLYYQLVQHVIALTIALVMLLIKFVLTLASGTVLHIRESQVKRTNARLIKNADFIIANREKTLHKMREVDLESLLLSEREMTEAFNNMIRILKEIHEDERADKITVIRDEVDAILAERFKERLASRRKVFGYDS